MTKSDAEFEIDEVPTRPDIAQSEAVSGVRRRLRSPQMPRAHDEKLDDVLLEYLLSGR